MKKTILLFLLFPLLVVAKFRTGTIYFNDGSSKSGFLEIPNYDDAKIKFRTNAKASTEKYKIDEVKSFEAMNDENVKVFYETLYLAKFKLFSTTEIKVDKNKSWVKIVKQGKITLYSAYYSYRYGNSVTEGRDYYIKKPSSENPLFIYNGDVSGFSIQMNAFSALKKSVKVHFDKDCPELAELLNKDELKRIGLSHIVELYDANCGD